MSDRYGHQGLGKKMEIPITILHVDKDYRVSYWLIGPKAKTVSEVTLSQAITLLKNFEFDLIISEPQGRAILQSPFKV
jgi:hypothetical protein